jgi:granule-bound starch synthase
MPCVNMLLGAVRTAGMVLTVSPRYAREVMSDPLKGCELETALKQVTVHGILNGVEDVVRPDNAVLGLTETYDADSLDKKKQVKAAMQSSLGLMVDPDTPVFLFMGRLDVQKGSGLEPLEEKATSLEDRFPGNFRAILSFKGAEKYRTFAAADFALMPSRYEPCGLVQMEGMRFGTLPIVAPTGGLSDTVFDMQTGIVMPKEVQQDSVVTEGDVSMLLDAISKACNLFRDEPTYRRMQRAAMGAAAAFSWSNSAKEYIAKFQSMW